MEESSIEFADDLFAELSEERTAELLLTALEEDRELASDDRLEGHMELFRDDSAMADELPGLALLDATISSGDLLSALLPAAELVVAVAILLKASSDLLLAAICTLLALSELARLERRLDDDKGTGFCAVLLTECFMVALVGGELWLPPPHAVKSEVKMKVNSRERNQPIKLSIVDLSTYMFLGVILFNNSIVLHKKPSYCFYKNCLAVNGKPYLLNKKSLCYSKI